MMHPNQHPAARQQRRLDRHVQDSDSDAFFNLLTGPRLLNEVEALLADYHERLFPPTETLSMFLAQVLSTEEETRLDEPIRVRSSTGHAEGS